MTIKLRFDRHPRFVARRVWTEDAALDPVAGLLDSDLQSPDDARSFAQILAEVVSGVADPFENSGNRYFFRVNREQTEVGVDNAANPSTISIATVDLIAAVEEWAEQLEHLIKKNGTYV